MLCSGLKLRPLATRCVNRTSAANARRGLLTVAIETSCDDTCVAVLEYKPGGIQTFGSDDHRHPAARLHFHKKITAPNTGKGGIHPLEAANSHRASLGRLIRDAVRNTFVPDTVGKSTLRPFRNRPHFVTVTRGPGMRNNLSSGLDTAKGVAAAFGVPLIGVHHMQAHALTPRLVNALQQPVKNGTGHQPKPAFPFLTLLVSGGHTMLLHSCSLIDQTILADTMDIAIGDCLDKCGRTILPDSVKSGTPDTAYGKHLSTYAFPESSAFSSYPIPVKRSDEIEKPLNRYDWRIQPPLGETRKLAFSYSGFVSHVDRIMSSKPNMSDDERLLLARTALGAAFEHLCSRTIVALQSLRDQDIHLTTLVVSGGVAANDFLRYFLRQMLDTRGFGCIELIFPPIKMDLPSGGTLEPCTDNAAMIAWAGMEMFMAGWRSDLSMVAIPKWSMDPEIDGGITGVAGSFNAIEEFHPEWDSEDGKKLEFLQIQSQLNNGDQVAKSNQIEALWKLRGEIGEEDTKLERERLTE